MRLELGKPCALGGVCPNSRSGIFVILTAGEKPGRHRPLGDVLLVGQERDGTARIASGAELFDPNDNAHWR